MDADHVDGSRFLRLAAQGRQLLDAPSVDEAAGHLDQGLALWRGPALGEFEAEAWAAAAAARLVEAPGGYRRGFDISGSPHDKHGVVGAVAAAQVGDHGNDDRADDALFDAQPDDDDCCSRLQLPATSSGGVDASVSAFPRGG